MNFFLSSIIAFLAGSIPFSLFIAKVFGKIDLRQHGSGNVGATNVARTMGARWGALALALDATKGILPTLLLPMFLDVGKGMEIHQAVTCGVCAVLGHMFSPWLGFSGGKGVATALGVVLVLAPISSAIAFVAFALSFALKRIVSLSSITAAIAFAIAQLAPNWSDIWTSRSWSLGAFSIVVPLLIIIRHRTNITRLSRGEEKPLSFGQSKDDNDGDSGEKDSQGNPNGTTQQKVMVPENS